MQRMTIRAIEDLTPSAALCSCCAGPSVRLSAVHHIDCNYARASLRAHIAEQHQLYLDASAKDLNPNVRRVALYLRTAGGEADATRRTLQQQERLLLDAIERRAHDGETIVSVYKESGPGIGATARPMFQRLLRAITHQTVDLVLVADLSRLARDLPTFHMAIQTMRAHGCGVVSVYDDWEASADRDSRDLTRSINSMRLT